MCFSLTHARYDPAHCLLPLFRSLQRGEREKLKLDITCDFGSKSIRFWGPEPLGVDDLRVLQGLVAMSAVMQERLILPADPVTEKGQKLRSLLETKFDAANDDAIVVSGSYRQLAKEIGYADIEGGARFKAIRACIERLWAVSVIVESAGKKQGFRLLSEYASDEKSGNLFVALNPLLTSAIVGRTQHLRIDMSEVRNLKSDAARLMHQRLHWINAGQARSVALDALCSYVWPDATDKAGTVRTRKRTARKALAELESLGWLIEEYAKDKFKITRPAPGITQTHQKNKAD